MCLGKVKEWWERIDGVSVHAFFFLRVCAGLMWDYWVRFAPSGFAPSLFSYASMVRCQMVSVLVAWSAYQMVSRYRRGPVSSSGFFAFGFLWALPKSTCYCLDVSRR